jgi:ABC-type transport system involved in multi-copper enzyme maturation permease subunit
MTNRIAALAHYTIVEAVRTRLVVLTVCAIGIIFGASFFVREIAITESTRFQTAFYAATVRYACVFIGALYTISSVAREFHDKGLDVMLALDLPRWHYIVGRLAGFLTVAVLIAGLASLPLVTLASAQPVVQWGMSFALELCVIVALSLFCAVNFNQLLPAFGVVASFYVLARALTAIRLISANPIAHADAMSHRVMAWLVEALAFVTPSFDSWTRTAWLVDSAATHTALLSIAAQSALFVSLFASAAIFDIYRRNF